MSNHDPARLAEAHKDLRTTELEQDAAAGAVAGSDPRRKRRARSHARSESSSSSSQGSEPPGEAAAEVEKGLCAAFMMGKRKMI